MAKISRFLVLILIAATACFGVPPAAAQEGETVTSIQVEGNQRVDASTILYYIQTQVGEPLRRMQVRKDIEQIYSLGQFKDIRVETRSSPGGVDLIFRVEEIPSIGNITLTGNKEIDTDTIREAIGLKRGATFLDHLVKESQEDIKKLYQEKGYFFADVKIFTETTPNNLVDVTIRISEGEKVHVETIRFVGNKTFPDDDLRDQMETREQTWLHWLDDSGIYQKDILKLDLFRVEGFYQDHGFIRVRVLEPKTQVNEKENEIYITIPVEEGPRYKVGKVEIKGDGTVSNEEIFEIITTRSGDFYNMSGLREDALAISDLYSQKGYAYADVNPLTQIDDEKRRVNVAIEIDKGKKVYVGEITILGNVKSRDNIIRREFRLREGDLFDSQKLKRSKQRINNLQYFEDVKIDTRRGKKPELIDVVTTVTERPTGSLSVGAGFSSVENFIFSGSITQDNLFGRGQRLNFSASLSSIRSDFNLSFTDPRIFDTEILFGVDLFNRDTDFFSFSSRNRGGALRFGKNLTEFDWAGIAYRFEDVKISDVDPSEVTEFLKNERRITSRITPSFIRDTRDDFLNPSTGWRHVVRLEIAGGPLGGTNFLRSGYEITYYHPLIEKLVLAMHGEVNYADGYGGDDLPIFERYFMGGANSLRGYTIRDIGPQNSIGDPIGGTQSLLFNVELQYPLTTSLRAFVFYDRGNVFGPGQDLSTTAKTINLEDMRDSVGIGARFLSPFGPIGFAYGIKLDQAPGESEAEFHFTAGSAF